MRHRYNELRARIDVTERAMEVGIILDRIKEQIEIYSKEESISIEEAKRRLTEFEIKDYGRTKLDAIGNVANITSEMLEKWCLREITLEKLLEEIPYVVAEVQEILQPAGEGRFDESAVDRVLVRRHATLKDSEMHALRDLAKTLSLNRRRNRIIDEPDVEDALDAIEILEKLARTMFVPGSPYPDFGIVERDTWRTLDTHGFGRPEIICESIIGEAVASYGLRSFSERAWRICRTCLKEKKELVIGEYQCSECGKWSCVEHSSTTDRTICHICASTLGVR